MLSRRSIVRLVASILALAPLVTLSGCFPGSATERETRTVEVHHVTNGALQIDTNNGHIKVYADPAAAPPKVRISAELRAQTQERLKAANVIAVRSTDGLLRVFVDWPDGKPLNGEGCSFDVTLPDANGIKVHTSNGEIEIAGLAGAADLDSSNGKIQASRQAGLVDAKTSNGAIEIKGSTGSVRASTSNGRISVEDATESVNADTANGAITIELIDAAPGPVVADTSNGAINLRFGPAFQGRLRLKTSNGGVSLTGQENAPGAKLVSLAKNSATLEFGASKPESSCKTSNGAISVKCGGR